MEDKKKGDFIIEYVGEGGWKWMRGNDSYSVKGLNTSLNPTCIGSERSTLREQST